MRLSRSSFPPRKVLGLFLSLILERASVIICSWGCSSSCQGCKLLLRWCLLQLRQMHRWLQRCWHQRHLRHERCEARWRRRRSLRAKVDGLSAYHSLHYSQAKINSMPNKNGSYSGYGLHDLPPPLRPLVKVHPETGRPALLIGRHAYGIPGLSDSESEALLDSLVNFACQAPRTYHHQWSAGDAVVWDNRCLLHRACPWDMTEPRVMYHSRIGGDPLTESAAT